MHRLAQTSTESTSEVRDDAYFFALEEAMQQTPRGRWFLNEVANRTRAADSAKILSSLESLTASFNEARANASLDIMRRELQEMSASISQTRKEIASIKPSEAGNNRIDAATEELDHILRSTETATADILTATERLQAIGTELSAGGADKKLCMEIDELATNVMISCSFQDLTGQRTSKVVHALRYIEQRVNSMIQIWGINGGDAGTLPDLNKDKRRDAHLLNGPSKDGEGSSQDDIDKLMSGELDASSDQATPAGSFDQNPVFAAKGEAKPTPLAEEIDSTAVAPESSEPASQADIDAMFS